MVHRLSFEAPEIRYYTYENKDSIPEVPGVYAFFPILRIIPELGGDDKESLKKSLELYRGLYLPEELRIKPLKLPINKWRNVELNEGVFSLMGRNFDGILDAINGITDKEAVNQLLRRLSPFLPPLYVGMTTVSLQYRYDQHINENNSAKDTNDFYSRLTCRSEGLGVKLKPHQLMFACVPFTTPHKGIDLTDTKTIKAFEEIMQIITAPTLSEQ